MDMEIHEEQQTPQPQQPQIPWPKALFLDIKEFIYILAIFMLVYVLFFRMVVVSGSSMYDTLVHGDRLLLISNVLYTDPQPGDIVVASKDSFRGGECIIKRIIAVEGQTVDIDFSTGNVYVDDILQEEAYISSPTLINEGTEFPLTVAEGCVFVMGDNRMDSLDSRDPAVGQLDCREILGKAVLLIFPGAGEHGEVKPDYSRIGVVE